MRPLSQDILKDRMKSLEENPPAHLLRLVAFQDPSVLPKSINFGGWFGFGDAIASTFPSHTATKLLYIISGQHQYAAAVAVAEKLGKDRLPVPRCFHLPVSALKGGWWIMDIVSLMFSMGCIT